MEINLDGVCVRYEVMGTGEKEVLLLHGWGACVEAMAPIYQFLEQKYKVYVLDFPGESGKSNPPTIPWGVPEYGEMVKKFMEELKIKYPSVIGHSFGGRVTIYLASKYPNLFDKIILTDAAGIKPKMTLKSRIRSLKYQCGKWVLTTFVPKAKRDKVMQSYRDKHSSSDYKALKSEVMKETFKKVISLDLTDQLEKIIRPTLLVWGENDKDTPLSMAHIMEEKIKDVGLVVLKEAGHFSYLDKSYEYNAIIDSFLGGR